MLVDITEVQEWLKENTAHRVIENTDEYGDILSCDFWLEAFLEDFTREFANRHQFAGQPTYVERAAMQGTNQATHVRYAFDFSIGFQHDWKKIVNRMNEAFRVIVAQETGQEMSKEDFPDFSEEPL
jgi:hypothetical protein